VNQKWRIRQEFGKPTNPPRGAETTFSKAFSFGTLFGQRNRSTLSINRGQLWQIGIPHRKHPSAAKAETCSQDSIGMAEAMPFKTVPAKVYQ
jgi:hypothetical protein